MFDPLETVPKFVVPITSSSYLPRKGLARQYFTGLTDQGYLSVDGRLLVTVRYSYRWSSLWALPFTMVKLYRTRVMDISDSYSEHADVNASQYRAWRLFTHPPPVCQRHNVVVSLELGYIAMMNDHLLSVYQVS
jgi:hypothetical protein